jgi:hypothetical protein
MACSLRRARVLMVMATILAGPALCHFSPIPFHQRDSSEPLPGPATDKYDPRNKDWASVASACLAAGNHEKRLFNFFTRASFHDAMAVPTVPCGTCAGGAGVPPAPLTQSVSVCLALSLSLPQHIHEAGVCLVIPPVRGLSGGSRKMPFPDFSSTT